MLALAALVLGIELAQQLILALSRRHAAEGKQLGLLLLGHAHPAAPKGAQLQVVRPAVAAQLRRESSDGWMSPGG